MDLNLMKFYESAEFDQMRRLSTASCPSSSSNCYTVWKYFCRDHFGWREYSEVWPFPALLLACSPTLHAAHSGYIHVQPGSSADTQGGDLGTL